jgi:hypothetical protein
MNTELELKLTKEHPSIFRGHGGDPRETGMAFGIECGNGWYRLISRLCKHIDGLVEWVNRIEPTAKFEVIAFQVKEKYGTLRFYVDFRFDPELPTEIMKRVNGIMDRISGAIDFAESMSGTICEECGQNGEINRSEAWMRCRCRSCAICEYMETPNEEPHDGQGTSGAD